MHLEQSEIRRNREKFTLELRKQNREQIFMKRRNLAAQKTSTMEDQGIEQTPIVVLDQRFKDTIEQAIKKSYKQEELASMIAALSTANPIGKHAAIIGIRKIISAQQNQNAVQAALDKGALPIIISLLGLKEFPHIRFESCWIISNIAAGTNDHCAQVVQSKGLGPLFQLLKESHYKLNQQAIWAIGNIAGDSVKMRDQILKQYGIAPLITIAEKSTQKSVIKLSVWAISNLCRGSPLPKYETIKTGLPTIAKIILSQVLPDQQLSDCLWAIANHTNDGQKTRIQTIVSIPNFVACLVNLCKNATKPSIKVPSLRIIGNISVGNQLHTQQILKGGGLQLLFGLLHDQKKTIRRQACWIISNICGGTSSQVKQVIFRNELITKLSSMLVEDEINIKKEICFVFKNICSVGDKRIVLELITNLHISESIVNIIKQNDDKTILSPALKCLFELFGVGVQQGGISNVVLRQVEGIPRCLERLQQLQHHTQEQIYLLVVKIFQTFFSLEQIPTL